MTEGSLDVKLPTIRTDGKPEVGRVRDEMRREEKRREEKRRGAERRGETRRGREEKRRDEKRRTEQNREDQRRERVRRKKMQVREKVEKSGSTMFFQWFVAPEGRKVGSLKRRVRSHLARWEMKNCTPLWPEAHFEVKMYKTSHARTTFGSWDVEKVHAVVAQRSLCAFCREVVPTKPFTNTALYYKMTLES